LKTLNRFVAFLSRRGSTIEQVAAGILGSGEYFQSHGGTNSGFVYAVFQNVLGRSPSPTELANDINVLNAGGSRATVARALLTSTEYRTNLVINDFSMFLGRLPTSAQLSTLLSALQHGRSDQTIAAAILSLRPV
jgi:hypothetical protein